MKLSDLKQFKKNAGMTGKYIKYENQMVVCITTGGQLVLSAAVFDALGNPEAVTYMTDNEKTIAILPSNKDAYNSYVVQKPYDGSRRGYRFLNCGALLKSLKFDRAKEKTLAYPVKLEEGAVWLDLSTFPSVV